MPSREQALAAVARRQHSLFTHAQARSCGFSEDAIVHQVRADRWTRLAQGLYLINGVPVTWEMQLMGSCLLTGGVASHRSAAALLEVPGFGRGRREITVSRGRHGALQRTLVHTSTDLGRAVVVLIDGIPTTDPARLSVDLGGVVTGERYMRAMQDLIARRKLTWEDAATALRVHERRGRRGIAAARAFLLECYGDEIDESSLEQLFTEFRIHHDLPSPVPQYEVFVDGRFVARVDFCWPRQRVIVEADSYRHHLNHVAFEADKAKRLEMRADGWNVIEVTKRLIVTEPGALARNLRKALGC